MRIQITGRHIDIDDAKRSYIEEKFRNIDYHPDEIIETKIILEPLSAGMFKGEVTAHSKVGTFFAEVKGNDLRQIIDSLADKIEKQILKKRGRLSEKR